MDLASALRQKTRASADGKHGFENTQKIARLVSDLLPRDRPGFFVELGANDGLTRSNTWSLEKDHGWRGVLIEPSLNRYLDCVRNRAKDNHFECAACVPFGYSDEFVRMTYANLKTVSRGFAVDLPDEEAHLTSWRRRFPAKVVDFGAIAKTLNSILIDAGAPRRIDFMSLDVEGAEIPVLQGVDHERFRFTVMIVENRSPEALIPLLRGWGYDLIAESSNPKYSDYVFRDAQPSRSSA